MPIAIRVDPAHRLRYAAAHGVLTDADVLEGYGAALQDPAFDPAFNLVFDCTAVERLDVAPRTLERISQLVDREDRAIPVGVRPRVAIVAPADATFGFARMYEMQREARNPPKDYRVCRTVDEAMEWLMVEPDRGHPAS